MIMLLGSLIYILFTIVVIQKSSLKYTSYHSTHVWSHFRRSFKDQKTKALIYYNSEIFWKSNTRWDWKNQWFRQFISIKLFVKQLWSCGIDVYIPLNRFSCPKKIRCSYLYKKSNQTILYKIHDFMHFFWNFIHAHQFILFNTFKIRCVHYLSAAFLIYWHCI